MSTTVLQAYQFALDPTEAQVDALRSHCGAARFAYNWGLARVQAVLEQRSAERSYDVAENELTPAVNWSAYSPRKAFNAAKDEVAPWWRENSKEAYASGLANLADALGNWHRSRPGPRRRGHRSGSARRARAGRPASAARARAPGYVRSARSRPRRRPWWTSNATMGSSAGSACSLPPARRDAAAAACARRV